ncbi:sulfatase [Bacteroidota bacterium]
MLVCILSLILCGCNSKEKAPPLKASPEKPNIILIVADDHGADALGCYGNPVIQTPNLDRMAAQGVRFTRAYCTTASCSASRSTILTGMYNHFTGQYGHEHRYSHFTAFDHLKSLPLYLADAGYHTARIGKYHVAPEHVFHFDEELKGGGRSDIKMAENCTEMINREDLFFLYFCYSDPHRGQAASDEWSAPNLFGNKPGGYPGEKVKNYSPDEVIVPPFLPDSKESREELAEYYQSVSRIDQSIGKLMEILNEADKTDNTMIIYISDNGIAFPGAKTTTYEPGINLPCIITAPWINNKSIVNNAMITWVDLAPTILDFAGIDATGLGMHGRSFKSILEQENPVGWDEIYASHTFHAILEYYPMRVVEDRRFKLIWNLAYQLPYPFASDLLASSTWQGVARRQETYYGKRKVEAYIHRPEFELYYLVNDPYELENLSKNPEYSEILETMKQKIKDFQSRTNDPWINQWKTREIYDGRKN